LGGLVEWIARALERLAPPSPRRPDFDQAEAFICQAEPDAFLPVAAVNRVPLSLLKGIDRMRDVLFDNTVRFVWGLPANNALLWGRTRHGQKLPRQGCACGGKP
jgi:predicted AAA+ superfamily ATPase